MNVLTSFAFALLTLIASVFGFALALPRFKKVKPHWNSLFIFGLMVLPFATALEARGAPYWPNSVLGLSDMVFSAFCVVVGATPIMFGFWWLVFTFVRFLSFLWRRLPARELKPTT